MPLPIVKTTDSEIVISLPPDKLQMIAYAWCDNPELGKLRTAAGLPVFPFCFNL